MAIRLSQYRIDGRNGDWMIRNHDAAQTGGVKNKQEGRKRLHALKEELIELQRRLHAQEHYGLLLVLQAMDAGGKDGTVRHVMSGVNPQGCRISSFKAPSAVERNHDFLWRIHFSSPARGHIRIFNRSHYEDVVIARIHADKLLPEWARRRKNLWHERFEQIRNFERLLVQNNILVVKCFLNISKEEQKRRLERRLADPARNWKFDQADLDERQHWDHYMRTYEDVFKQTTTKQAPWYIIPADKKWYRNVVVAELLVQTLRKLKLAYPVADPEKLQDIVID
mgnify:CR=1 FL=1